MSCQTILFNTFKLSALLIQYLISVSLNSTLDCIRHGYGKLKKKQGENKQKEKIERSNEWKKDMNTQHLLIEFEKNKMKH